MIGSKIGKAVLKDAWVELNFIKNRQFCEGVASGISWEDVEEQLRRLDEALEEGNERNLKEAASVLSRQLNNRKQIVRTIIDSKPQDKMRPLPPPIWEHLNHIVSRLQMESRPNVDVRDKPLVSSGTKP